jgi:hypothetical protein
MFIFQVFISYNLSIDGTNDVAVEQQQSDDVFGWKD